MHAARAGGLRRRSARAASQLSPKGVRKIGQLALRDIYQGLLRDRPGGHQTDHRGLAEVRPEETQAVPLRRSAARSIWCARSRRRSRARPARRSSCVPDDFEVYDDRLHTTTTSTVLLLDMSWSMSWEGRFAAAKKVALAMESLIRSRYPRDYFAIVGFYTRAVELKLRDLPEASWNMGDPFTNLQDGLRLGDRAAGAPPEQQPAHHRHHRRPADGVLLARPAVLRVAAVLRRHQHARRAGDAEGGRARHPQGHHHQHLHARRQPQPARLRRAHDPHQQRPRALHPPGPSRRVPAGRLHRPKKRKRV